MKIETDFARLIDHAPKVTCERCTVEMTLRQMVPKGEGSTEYTATFRCPKCGTDTLREFSVPA